MSIWVPSGDRCSTAVRVISATYVYTHTYIISSLSAGKPRSLLERTDGTDVPLGDRLQLQGSRALPLALALAPHSPRNRHRSHPLELAKKPLLTYQALGFLVETLEVLGVEKDVFRLFQATGAFPKSREFRCNLRN